MPDTEGEIPEKERRAILEELVGRPGREIIQEVTGGREMWETTTVQLNVRLPKDLALQAEEVQRTDPEFLSRVVLYGLTRRSIHRHLRDQSAQGGGV